MDGGYDGIVVAKAGLERLYLGLDTVGTRSTVEDLPFITSAGQGAIAVVTRENSSAEDMIKPLDDWRSRMETDVERIIMGAFGGSCREPMGVMAKLKNDGIDVRAEVLSLDGTRCECLEKRIRIQNYKENAIRMGEELNYKKAGVLSTH
jgi:hydroxymethylbilane synthase